MDCESYENMNLLEESHWWFVSRKKIIKSILDIYVTKNNSKSILEIGCGSGGNLKLLSEYGDISAIEMDNYSRKQANEKNICKVKDGRLPNKLSINGLFDTICLFDVLEHIDNDLRSLKTIYDHLNVDGKIILTVPAYKFLWSGHDVASHHKRRYTKKQIVNILADSGFIICYSTYFNTLLFPIISFIRILNKVFIRKESNTDVKKENQIINILLEKVFSLESKILPKITFPFGVSILAIGKK